MMIYGFREREMVLAFFEKTTGLRMNHNFIRPGGVAADLPDGWQDDIEVLCDTVLARSYEYAELLTGQPIFRERTEAVGNISAEEALALRSPARSCARPDSPGTCAAQPYLAYDKLDFDVIVGAYGDVFDRYPLRLDEILESVKIVRQIVEKMPPGDYRMQDRKITPPPGPHRRDHGSAHPPLQALHRGLPGARRRVYVAIESPRGEIGCYMVRRDVQAAACTSADRGRNLQALPLLLRGGLMADAVAVISSVQPVMGEVDR